MFTPIIGSFKLKTDKGYIIKFHDEDITTVLDEFKHGNETFSEARKNLLQYLSEQLVLQGIPAISVENGIITLVRWEDTQPMIVKVKGEKKNLKIASIREIKLSLTVTQRIIHEIIKNQLNRKAVLTDKERFYFDISINIIPDSQTENISVYRGFKIQYYVDKNDFYLGLTEYYKFILTPSLDYYIKKYGPKLFVDKFKGWHVNTEPEYHTRKYGPAYAGKIVNIHTPDIEGYSSILDDIIEYYKTKKPQVWRNYISTKLQEKPNPPIVYLNKAGTNLTYLSSILVLAPNVEQIIALASELFGEEAVDVIYQVIHPSATRYYKMMNSFRDTIRTALENNPYITGKLGWVSL